MTTKKDITIKLLNNVTGKEETIQADKFILVTGDKTEGGVEVSVRAIEDIPFMKMAIIALEKGVDGMEEVELEEAQVGVREFIKDQLGELKAKEFDRYAKDMERKVMQAQSEKEAEMIEKKAKKEFDEKFGRDLLEKTKGSPHIN